jgi:hypothetical protein
LIEAPALPPGRLMVMAPRRGGAQCRMTFVTLQRVIEWK